MKKHCGSCRGGCLLAAALAAPAVAQDKPVELRFSHWVPPSHPMHPAVEAWAESIKQASNGTITMKIYPAQQLGKAFDHYNMARDGIADFAHVNPGYEPGRFPIMGLSEIPFIFANSKAGLGRARCLVSQIRRQGDEGRQILPHLRARPGDLPHHQQEGDGARRREGHEDPSGQCHDQPFRALCLAAPMFRRRRRNRATSSRRAWPKASPSRGDRSFCSASTR